MEMEDMPTKKATSFSKFMMQYEKKWTKPEKKLARNVYQFYFDWQDLLQKAKELQNTDA